MPTWLGSRSYGNARSWLGGLGLRSAPSRHFFPISSSSSGSSRLASSGRSSWSVRSAKGRSSSPTAPLPTSSAPCWRAAPRSSRSGGNDDGLGAADAAAFVDVGGGGRSAVHAGELSRRRREDLGDLPLHGSKNAAVTAQYYPGTATTALTCSESGGRCEAWLARSGRPDGQAARSHRGGLP